MAVPAGRVLVYGGKGALGSVIVSHFKAQNWWVGCIDMFPNENADANIVVEASDSWLTQDQAVGEKVEATIGSDKLDAILCVAGGWAGGNAANKDFIKSCDMMWKQSVWTSAIAGQLAAKHLKEGGMLVLTGAHPAQNPTPGMIGYGMAKAAVHQLVSSLAGPKSGLPSDSSVAAILPVTLDTPMNRKFMPKADQTTWTPLQTVAELLYNWSSNNSRPTSGSLVQLFTKEGKTEFVNA